MCRLSLGICRGPCRHCPHTCVSSLALSIFLCLMAPSSMGQLSVLVMQFGDTLQGLPSQSPTGKKSCMPRVGRVAIGLVALSLFCRGLPSCWLQASFPVYRRALASCSFSRAISPFVTGLHDLISPQLCKAPSINADRRIVGNATQSFMPPCCSPVAPVALSCSVSCTESMLPSSSLSRPSVVFRLLSACHLSTP